MTSPLSIFLGRGCITVTPRTPPDLDLGPFLIPPPEAPRFDFTLSLRPLPAQPISAPCLHRRRDLVFVLDPSRTQGTAYTDGSKGAFLAALELALQVALLDDNALLIHAAAGVVEEGAWLLPGPSGTGKSTAAREAGFDAVLTDERVIVRTDDGQPTVWGTPFWSDGRTLPLRAAHAPLAVLGRLEHASTFQCSDWAADAAMTYLLENVALYESGSATVRAFELAGDIVAGARCLRVGFQKTGAWPLRGSRAA